MNNALPTRLLALALMAGAAAQPMIATARTDAQVSVQQDGARKIVRSGVRANEARTVTPFTGVAVSDASNVVITVGEALSVSVTADDNLLRQISTETRNGTLHIDTKGSYSARQAPLVTITLPSLESVTLSGSGDARVKGMNGGGVTLRGEGSGDFVVSGRADTITLRIDGSGDADLSGLAVKDINAIVNGSGSATIRATGKIRASVFGSGDIRYAGTDNIERQVFGTGRIVRQGG